MPIPVSAVMITHQSDRRLEQVLKSLEWCSEVVVVDSMSTDQTAALAKQAHTPLRSVKFIQRAFDGFSNQKQFSVDQATHDWVLVIDSDEVISDSLQVEFKKLLNAQSLPSVAYEIPRELYFLGDKVAHGGGTDYPLRFFNRKFGRFDGAAVHEKIVVTGNVGRLTEPMSHYSYDSLAEYFKKFTRYTTLAAQEWAQNKGPASRGVALVKIMTSFPSQFIKLYVLKAGFLDGWAGFLWCLLSALSPVVKYYKVLVLPKSR